MSTLALLRHQIEMSKKMTSGLLADMHDAPMTFPTPNGGNHPTWVAGHLAYAEGSLVQHMMLGEANPLIEWQSLFGIGSQPTADAADYPPLTELLAKWDEMREYTLKVLDSLTEADLEKPSANVPEGREENFGTYGKILTMVAFHPLLHRGQVSDARRAAGRDALMA